MSHEAINSWVKKAKKNQITNVVDGSVVKVITSGNEVRNNGSLIMEIAEKIRPFLQRMFTGVRDEEGMLMQPAHIRGMALNVAQGIVKKAKED